MGKAASRSATSCPTWRSMADEMCVIRSCHGDSVNHPQSVYQMNTGSIQMGKPSLGSWVSYGLGSENADMPAFVVLPDPGGGLKGGPPAWGSGFLPATYQGTTMRAGEQSHPGSAKPAQQRSPARHAGPHPADERAAISPSHAGDSVLDARIRAYELAFRMQSRRAGGGGHLARDGGHEASLRHRRSARRRSSAPAACSHAA
jgi:hypothetical protein